MMRNLLLCLLLPPAVCSGIENDDIGYAADTAAAPAPSTSSRTPASNSTDLLWVLSNMVDHELYHPGWQGLNALGAAAIGVMMVYDAMSIFKMFLVAWSFVVGYILSLGQLAALYPELGAGDRVFVSLEVALLLGFVAYKGYDGAKLVFGACAGAYIAHGLLAGTSTSFFWCVLISSFFLWLGVWLFNGFGRDVILPILAPFGGGCLIASAVGYFAMAVAKVFGFQSPCTGTELWITFFRSVTGRGEPVGVLVGTQYEFTYVLGMKWQNDVCLGRLLWCSLFLVGMWRFKNVHYRDFFEALDKNHDGKLDREELRYGLQEGLLSGSFEVPHREQAFREHQHHGDHHTGGVRHAGGGHFHHVC